MSQIDAWVQYYLAIAERSEGRGRQSLKDSHFLLYEATWLKNEFRAQVKRADAFRRAEDATWFFSRARHYRACARVEAAVNGH